MHFSSPGHPSFPVNSPSPSPVPSRGQTNGHKSTFSPLFPRLTYYSFLGQYKISKLLSLSGHHISPTIPPIPPEPETTAPSAHPIWTLPPPPPNLGAVFYSVLICLSFQNLCIRSNIYLLGV
jgi:hypothetical protein